MSTSRSELSKDSQGLDLSAFRQLSESDGPSLDQLSAALAGMLERGHDPYSVPTEESAGPAAAPATAVAGEQEPDEACPISPRSILEALLFVGGPTGEPLTAHQAAGMMRGVRPVEIDALVSELNRDYAARRCPYTIADEGAGYRMKLRDEYGRIRDNFYGKGRAARLSQAAIEVLAIVAYQAPVTADEISRLRGKPSGHVLLGLVRRQLVRLERSTSKPRKVHYSPAPRFLELFGLASLADLPRSQDLEQ